MFENVRVILPKKYDLVVGDTFQLFYRGVVEAPNPYVFDIAAYCVKGKNFPRYFEFTPEAEGRYELTINVCGPDKTVLGQGKTILNVVNPKIPEKPLNILCVGDSLTESGTWINEVNRRLNCEGGTPAGLGFKDKFKFVGNCRVDSVGFEAFGGWAWECFATHRRSNIWVYCEHDKDKTDQHSIWLDESGAAWRLETIEKDRLKFTRHLLHAADKPESGLLTHKETANHTSPIKIISTKNEASNPFVNPETEELDFNYYAEKTGIDTLDAAYFFLGANGWQFWNKETMRPCYEKFISYGKKIVSKLKEAFPNVKVKVFMAPHASVNGGTGTNYGAILPWSDRYLGSTFINEVNLAYERWAEEDEFKDFLEAFNLASQYDSEYNYPSIQKPVNTRSEITERFDINAAHPTNAGYMQIADAVYRNIVASFCKE